jgi:TPR repeat protein
VTVPVAEQRKLLQRSGGVCAFPRCRRQLTVDASATDPIVALGEIAHIVAERPGGPRGSSPLTAKERSRCENLILLCAHHHQLIDSQPDTWTVARLTVMKQLHERWVRRRLAAIDPVTGDRPAEADAEGDEFIAWFLGVGDLPRADAAIDRALLGIHASLPLPSGASAGLSAQLPTYVPRDLDEELRSALKEHSSHGGFLLLAGEAASGKTRCAYEAVRATLPDWRMLLPPSARDLAALVIAGIPLGRTIIWLDDAVHFLGPGALTARTVRRLLADCTEPVILIGTIWPTDYDRLLDPASQGDKRELNAEPRQILRLAHRFEVPGQFSAAEWSRALQIAATDPRIREAVAHAEAAAVPSTLACAPDLIRRWEQPSDPAGAAVITAAVEACLCGHPAVIGPDLLQRLAEEYLTSAQKAAATPGWFTTAVAWACRPVRGTVAPLVPSARRIGELDGYTVSDILVHRGARRFAAQQALPTAPWDILADYADIDACGDVGLRAMYYGQTSHAIHALRRRADTGDTETMVTLGMTYLDEGDLGSAQAWYQKAAEAGNGMAMALLAVVVGKLGDNKAARLWLQRGAEAGNTAAMVGIGSELEKDGEIAAARAWYQKSTEAGDDGQGMLFLGCLLRDQGDLQAARDCFRQALEAGRAFADELLPFLPVPGGVTGNASRRYMHDVTQTYTQAALCLGELCAVLGETTDARAYLEEAASLGHVRAMMMLGSTLWEAGEADPALTWFRAAVEAGEPNAAFYLGMILDDRGDVEAGVWLERAATSGAALAMGRYAIYLHDHGDVGGAREWGSRARDAGDPLVGVLLAQREGQHIPPAIPVSPVDLNQADDSKDADAGQISWTPLRHTCDCVADWGWDAAHADPLNFIRWCMSAVDDVCPWHAIDPAGTISAPQTPLMIGDPGAGPAFYAREATGEDVELGRTLAAELTELASLIAVADADAILAMIPPSYREWTSNQGYDPVEAWLDMRLADIVLNRGHSVTPALLQHLDRSQQPEEPSGTHRPGTRTHRTN